MKKSFVAVVAGISATLLSLGVPLIAEASTSWSAPTSISLPGGNAEAQRVSVSPSGRAVAIWDRIENGAMVLQSSNSVRGGAWTTPVNISSGSQSVYGEQIAIDSSGRAIVIWQGNNGTNDLIQVSESVNGGAWSIPVVISTAGQDADKPQLSIDGSGRAVALWRQYNGTRYVIQSSTSLSGATWSSPVTVSPSAYDTRSPQLSVNASGRAVAVWYYFRGGHTVIQSSTSENGGPWSTAVNVSGLGQDAESPQIVVDSSGRMTALWQNSDNRNWIAQASSSTDGITWATPVDLSAAGNDARTPRLAADSSGRAIAVWSRSNGGNRIIQSASSINGGAWSATVDVSTTAVDSGTEEITVGTDGRAVVAWDGWDGGNNLVQTSYSVDGAPWSSPVTLSRAGENSYAPVPAVDSYGHWAMVWNHGDGITGFVDASYQFIPTGEVDPSQLDPASSSLSNTGADNRLTVGLLLLGLLAFASGTSLVISSRRKASASNGSN